MINFALRQKTTQHCKSAMLLCCLAAKSCPTLWDHMDCSLPGSSICGISQARILEWFCISFPFDPSPVMKPTSPALQLDSLPHYEGIEITVHYLSPAKGLPWLEHRNWFKLRDKQRWHDHLSRLLSPWSLQVVNKLCTEHAQDTVASG